MGWCASLLVALLAGCPQPKDDSGAPPEAVLDADGDGYAAAYDCNDQDPSIYPAAPETWYDGVDADCAGDSDYDADRDGEDRLPEGPDCDDTRADVYAAADETCDEVDNDCDGAVDDDPVDASEVWVDDDGDGWGRGAPLGAACEAGVGQATAGGDCNDGDAEVHPEARETCDGVDQDCDDLVDDDPSDGVVVHPDADGDGWGDDDVTAVACEVPAGWLLTDGDCDDGDPQSHPDAAELCDLEDNDCDGVIDEGATDPRTYYRDADGDGWGRDDDTTTGCGAPTGYAEGAGDCDDADPTRSPGTTETCNGVDDDCDGELDSDAVDAVDFHPDGDGDGWGDAATTTRSCGTVEGWLTDGSDCDDADPAVNPDGTESCNGRDDDCDGTVDPSGSAGSVVFYGDADGDGYGGTDVTILACTAPYGYADNDDDCDDALATVSPGNRESCDGVDDDCDGSVDEDDAVDAATWYADADGDGYGDPDDARAGCAAPAGYVADDADCDDRDPAVNPDGTEVDDLGDQDCDGLVDEDFVAVGDLVVTEVARQPYTGGSGTATNANAQWFEVLNTSSRTLDLSGWFVEEQDADSFYVSPDAGLVLGPGERAVFCYTDIYFADPGVCAYTWGDSGLGSPHFDTTFYFDRDEDLISLFMGGTRMDEVHWTYDATNGYWPRVARYSMELDAAASQDPTTNDDEANWCQSDATIYASSAYSGYPDYGTPGTDNGACP